MPELLTSLDVVNQSFKKSLRGYDPTEVDEFLDHVAETLQNYNQKNKELERDLAAKEESLAEYERMKDVLHEALLMAQKSADDRVKSARSQADKIIEDARDEAEEMRQEAAAEAETLRAGVEQIRNIREMFTSEVRGIISKFESQLKQATAPTPLSGAVASVLEEAAEPEEELSASDQAEDNNQPDRHSKKDLEAACGVLGVDPKEILGEKKD